MEKCRLKPQNIDIKHSFIITSKAYKMLVAVKRESARTKSKPHAYKERADAVLLSRGKSTEGKIFQSGSSEEEILSILNNLTH